jgi:hypothetical protein
MRKVSKLSLAVVRLYFIVKHTRTRCVLKAVKPYALRGSGHWWQNQKDKGTPRAFHTRAQSVFTLAKEWLEGGTRRAAHQ